MKHLTCFTFLMVTLALMPRPSHAQVTQQWIATNSGLGHAYMASMAQDGAGNTYLACSTNDFVSVTAVLILKYSQTGILLWSVQDATYDGASGIVLDGIGNIIVVGSMPAGTGYVMKIDASGTVLWSQNLPGRSDKNDIVTDEYNNIYVKVSYYNSSSQVVEELRKYDASGLLLWSQTASGGMAGLYYRDGYLYTHGSINMNLGSTPGTVEPVIVVNKLNPVSSAQIWSVNYAANVYGQTTRDIAVDEAGNVYVAGIDYLKAKKSWYNRNHNWLTLKYNSAGVLQWTATYDGNADDVVYNSGWNTPPSTRDEPSAIILDGYGNPCITGYSYMKSGSGKNGPTSHDITTIKYSASGAQLWIRTYDGPEKLDDYASSICASQAGNFYVSGSINSGGNVNAIVLKYSNAGVQEWAAIYDGGSAVADRFDEVRLDNTGNVFTAGNTGNQAMLLKYTQTGTPKASLDRDSFSSDGFSLSQNYPNPFNPSTTITYSLTEDSPVVLKVYNVLGMEIATLVNETKSAGTHSVTFDAHGLESGVYEYKLSVANQTLSKRMLLLK